ncbi:MAG: cardiolipin synthase [Campylobacter sp.]|nr:cardiolipin synthase [Campylobacter sp.]
MGNFLLWLISIEHIYFLICILAVISVLFSNKTPSATSGWVMVILFVPIIGILAYLLLGINWRQRKIINKFIFKTNRTGMLYMLNPDFSEFDSASIFEKSLPEEKFKEFISHPNLTNQTKEIITLLYRSEKTLPNFNDNYEIYYNGKEAFSSLLKDLKNAKKAIFMEYFIWRSDELGEAIKNVLVQKAKEGVEIKLIFDGVGSLNRISKAYRKELNEAGVEFLYFLDVKHSIFKLNYSSHRKMTIIDYYVLHTGGMNLGIEYITGGEQFNSWRDTNVRVEGELFLYYLVVFLTDWLNSGGEIEYEKVRNEIKIAMDKKYETSYPAQLSSSGPDSNYPSLKYLYTKMITNAKHEVLIQTPYFIPDEALLEQLKISALSGKKVRLMIAGIPDKMITYWVARTYFEELLMAGVEIYSYMDGFLHCKVVICDDDISTIGTCNFDARSFDINYEINTVFYNKEITQNLKEQFEKDILSSDKMTFDDLKKDGFLGKIRNSILRLIAPLL